MTALLSFAGRVWGCENLRTAVGVAPAGRLAGGTSRNDLSRSSKSNCGEREGEESETR